MSRNSLAILLCVTAQALLTVAAVGQTPAPTTAPANKSILFVGDARNEPFSYLNSDGQPAGFDVEVLAAVAGKLGRPIRIELLEDDEPSESGGPIPLNAMEKARQKVRAGLADGLVGAGISPSAEAEKTKEWLFCGPTTPMEYAIAVRAEDQFVRGVEDLHGTRVAIVRDDSVLSVFARNESISVVPVRSAVKGCLYLDGRLVTALIAPRCAVQCAARETGTKNLKFVGSTLWSLGKYGPAMRADGNAELAGQVQKAITELEQQGELEKLRQKYFNYELHRIHFWQRAGVQAGAIIVLSLGAVAAIGMAWRRDVSNRVLAATRRVHGEMEVLRRQLAELAGPGGHEAKTHPHHPPAEAMAEQAAAAALTPLGLNEFLLQAKPALQDALGGAATPLSMHLADDLPAVLADGQRLRDALLQLCTNARDAIAERRKHDPTVPPRAWISTRRARPDEMPPKFKSNGQSYVAVSVRDDGVGIAPELAQKIFEAGYTTKRGAAGQGLVVVYQTAAYHGGWIDVESAPNRGATFSLFLPAASD